LYVVEPLMPTPDVARVNVCGQAAVIVMFPVPSKLTPLIVR